MSSPPKSISPEPLTSASQRSKPSTGSQEEIDLAGETLSPETLLAGYLDNGDRSLDLKRVPLINRERYTELGDFGKGGMGEVKRVYDRLLGRDLAMKILKSEHADQTSLQERFVEEAQATAQLQHPSIIPVHDLGQFEDGRLWFTMQEVKGETLQSVIRSVHRESLTSWKVTKKGWHLRKLISLFAQVCEAVAYAHERGVIHRDLKPQNIMVGERGEVWVVDWGLVKVFQAQLSDAITPPNDYLVERDLKSTSGSSVTTDRSQDHSRDTVLGTISGTPSYMSPEQANGRVKLDLRTDVYSLGAILYEILCGRPPYTYLLERTDSVTRVLHGPPLSIEEVLMRDRLERLQSPRDLSSDEGAEETNRTTLSEGELSGGLALPQELLEISRRAMSRERDQRYHSVHALMNDLLPWIEGTQQRRKAFRLFQESEALSAQIESSTRQIDQFKTQAREKLSELETWRSEEEKAPIWALEDQAVELEREVAALRVNQEGLLRSALQHSSDLIEARLALAQLYRQDHERAEEEFADQSSVLHAELSLREALREIPHRHPQKLNHLSYLSGDGALSLVTDPPGAEVLLYRFQPYHRRLVPQFYRALGETPLKGVQLPPGSYLCKIKHPSTIEVSYPIYLERGSHWDGVPPEGGEATPIYLPRIGELSDEECYIPAGWFWSGGDPHSPKSLPRRRLWCDALVYQKFPVTNQEFMAFLHDLVRRGDEKQALRFAPREDGTSDENTTFIYDYHEGRFSFKAEEKWAMWRPDWPVYSIDWYGANAYADWVSERLGTPWRLPGDLEWEKVARGVDGRAYPWGDFFDPSWACMRDSHSSGDPSPASVYDYPHDETVYGVRGMSGNARSWCLDLWETDGPPLTSARVPEPARGDSDQEIYRALRGGSWYNSAPFLRACYRFDAIDKLRFRLLGFRLARRFVRPQHTPRLSQTRT